MLVTAIQKNNKVIHRNIALSKIDQSLYIINPPQEILSEPSEFWKIDGNTISIMNDEEKNVVLLGRNKESKLKELEEWWSNIELTGIKINGYDFYLGIENDDIAALTGTFVLSQQSISLGLANNQTVFTVFDKEKIPHQITFANMTSLLLQYGQTSVSLTQIYNDKKNEINNATSQSELDAITF